MQLTYLKAQEIINSILKEFEAMNKHGVIAVADTHGELLAFLRMENAKFHSIHLAINKAYTAARTQKATSELGKAVKDPVKGYDIAFYNDPKYTGFGGGVPVKSGEKVIGAVAVSGLSQEEDEELALKGIKEVFGN